MLTTYRLSSAQEITMELLISIKSSFKSKAIVITVEEDSEFELSDELKQILDERLIENKSNYISSEQSIQELKEKYGL
ncbi:MAG: hypothetical protein ACOVQ2_01320 [Flavobacterium sp.]|jgi:hypothetical protein